MQLFAQQTSVPTVSCRFFNAYGPKETNDHVIPHIMNQLKLEKTSIQLGNVSPKRDYIYVTDMADAVLKISLADTGLYETFNIGTGVEYSVKELFSKIKSMIRNDMVIDSTDILKRKIDRPHLCSDISKIRNEIGWSPKYDIDKGLTALINYDLKNSE